MEPSRYWHQFAPRQNFLRARSSVTAKYDLHWNKPTSYARSADVDRPSENCPFVPQKGLFMNALMENSFSQRVLASRLLDEERLGAARSAVQGDEDALPQYLIREGLLTRFQARQIRAGATGFHVDKYVVVDCIGQGGNGIVFKARHSLLPGRYVALKTIDARDLHNGNDLLARFRREIEIVSRLDHPNVVRAYDVVRTRTQLYLVLEYIEGRDLGALVRERGALPIQEAVDYTVQAARGLAYAHRCGIVHRDLKPGNLLLTRDRTVKLSDLGLARVYAQETDVDLSHKGLCLGTPEFMAPEQAEDASQADARSDLYSLGATLFHLLTAELPVTGSSQLHRLQRLLTQPTRPLMDSRPDVPSGLSALVDRLRARDPQERPSTADETIQLLEPFLRLAEPEPTAWEPHRKSMVVLEILQGKLSVPDACTQHGLSVEELEHWRIRFLEGGRNSLDPNAGTAESVRDLHAKIGAQAMEIETLKRQLGACKGK